MKSVDPAGTRTVPTIRWISVFGQIVPLGMSPDQFAKTRLSSNNSKRNRFFNPRPIDRDLRADWIC